MVTNNTIHFINSHKYYVTLYSKSSIVTGAEIYWPYMNSIGQVQLDNYTSLSWTKHSKIFVKDSISSGDYLLRIDFNNNKTNSYIYFDSFILVDLTEAFGNGNEPSIEWCDENIDYFDGTTTVYK